HGERKKESKEYEDALLWLRRVNRYFEDRWKLFDNDRMKINFAGDLMKGKAAHWFDAYVQERDQANRTNPHGNHLNSWTVFQERFTGFFYNGGLVGYTSTAPKHKHKRSRYTLMVQEEIQVRAWPKTRTRCTVTAKTVSQILKNLLL